MFFVFKWKKVCVSLVAALLFFFITAIIILIFSSNKSYTETFSDTKLNETKTLVIDPGHGGTDGGAVSFDGTAESTINLAVSQKLEKVAMLFGVCPIMTRENEELNYPELTSTISAKKLWDQKRRIDLINSVEDSVLISIHQNTYPDPRPKGSHVLYGPVDGSELLGKLTHNNLITALCPENRRVSEPVSEKIYLMRKAECPSILVECGFLSNPQETALLKNDEYQSKLAGVIFASYIQFLLASEEPLQQMSSGGYI